MYFSDTQLLVYYIKIQISTFRNILYSYLIYSVSTFRYVARIVIHCLARIVIHCLASLSSATSAPQITKYQPKDDAGRKRKADELRATRDAEVTDIVQQDFKRARLDLGVGGTVAGVAKRKKEVTMDSLHCLPSLGEVIDDIDAEEMKLEGLVGFFE